MNNKLNKQTVIILENVTGESLTKKFSVSYRNLVFITLGKRARHTWIFSKCFYCVLEVNTLNLLGIYQLNDRHLHIYLHSGRQ